MGSFRRYKEDLTKSEQHFHQVVQEGLKSKEFTDIVAWLTKELQILAQLDEKVDAIATPDDAPTFLLELSFVLKELGRFIYFLFSNKKICLLTGCVHPTLLEGSVNSRLQNTNDKLILLHFLCGELLAARMLSANQCDGEKQNDKGAKIMHHDSPPLVGVCCVTWRLLV